jgi:hypothetical protein
MELEIQQKNCFLTTYHPSFMVRWWVLVYYEMIMYPAAWHEA